MSTTPMQKPVRPAKFSSFRELGEFLKAQARWEMEDAMRKANPPQRRPPVEKPRANAQPANNGMPRFESFRQLAEYLRAQINEANTPVAAGRPANSRQTASAFSSNGGPVWSGASDSAKKPATGKTGVPAQKTGTARTQTVTPEARSRVENERLNKAGVGNIGLPGPNFGKAMPSYMQQGMTSGRDNPYYVPSPSGYNPAIVSSPKSSDLGKFIAKTAPRIGRAAAAGAADYFIPDEDYNYVAQAAVDQFMAPYCGVTIPFAAAQGFADPVADLAAGIPCGVYYGDKLYKLYKAAKKGAEAY